MQISKDIQLQFLNAIFAKNESNLDFIASNNPEARLNIYRNTIFSNLRNALKVTFPGVWKLLGDECAVSVVNYFCSLQKNLPNSGCLDDYGGLFPNFLTETKQLENWPYLEGYARYEWIKHKSYLVQSNIVAKTFADLENIGEQNIEKLLFCFMPSLHLFKSSFPIDEIEKFLSQDGEKNYNLSARESYGIVVNSDDQVVTYWIQDSLWYFIKLLSEKNTISESIEKTHEFFQFFKLEEAIYFLINKKLVKEIRY